MMFILLNHLEALQFSMATISVGTGLMLGTIVGSLLPVRTPSPYQR